MRLASSVGRVTRSAGDRLLGMFVPQMEASAGYQCSPTYMASACYGAGHVYAECECRSGRSYRRWITRCISGSGYTSPWERTTLAC